MHGTIDAERERNRLLFLENENLKAELEQVKLELKLERQNKFATHKQKQAATEPEVDTRPIQPAKKRGAPVGHTGWFRPTPTEYDWAIDVPAPRRCPNCLGPVNELPYGEPTEHLQEDIIDGEYRVVLYLHAACHCPQCDRHVEQAGKDEILLSRIGPFLRSKAIYLRNVIGISYRKVPRTIQELFGVSFTPATLLGFEDKLAQRATGTLVTYCYCGYAAHATDKKQKCLAHLARTARALRPLVVLRKITFGSRSEEGGQRLATLMTIAETARLHGHRASDIYFELLTRPPNAVMKRLYAHQPK